MNKIILIIILFPYLATAQEELSLLSAIKIGLNNNFDIQIIEKNNRISNLNNNWANAGALPSINIGAAKEEALSDQSNNAAAFIQAKLRSSSINGNGNVNWTLFNGFAIRANKQKLENLEKISDNNVTLTIENTIQGIILQYYNCVLQKEKSNLLEKVVNLAKSRLEYQQNKYNLGIINKIELLQIENAMLSDSSNLILQKLNYKNAIRNLNLTLGLEIDKKWLLKDSIETKIELFNYNDLKSNTLANNTNIKNQYYNIELAKQDIKISKAAFYPMISFNSGFSYNESKYDIGELSDVMNNTGESINYFANFSINFRLFDGGKLYNTLKKIRIQKVINELEHDKVKNDVLHQLSIIHDKYITSISTYSLSKKALEIAETNYNLAWERQKIGTINSFMYRDIEITYISSALNAQESAFKFIQNKIELLKISGGIIQSFNN